MIDIIKSTNDFVVCVKPVGVNSQNDNSEDMVKLLSQQLDSQIFPVHRLDTAVGGTMVFARTKQAAAIISKEIAEHGFSKSYLAVVAGKPDKDEDTFEDLLFKDSRKNKSYVVKRERKGVKKAKLSYKILQSLSDKTLVKVTLHTGRFHQIRVQFASRKMPLLGDGKYGSTDKGCSVALWSNEISFSFKGENYSFASFPDFEKYPWNEFSAF